MPSDSKESNSKRGRLPFEPGQGKSKDQKSKTASKKPATNQSARQKAQSSSRYSRPNSNLSAIPDVVSKRMGLRMALFCGVPSALGMSSLFIFYWLKIKDIIELPPYLALAVSLGFLALGVMGLSYGIFSTCWDEDREGGLLGLDEFRINFERTKLAWRASRQKTES